MKIIPFFENLQDNKHCGQTCLKMALKFYFPEKDFDILNDIDPNVSPSHGWSWLQPATAWLDQLGLQTNLYSTMEPDKSFNNFEFAKNGDFYLKNYWPSTYYQEQSIGGGLTNIDFIQAKCQEIVNKNLYIDEKITDIKLNNILQNEKNLAIGKMKKNPHIVLIIKKYSPTQWLIHNPGLPAKANEKISGLIEDNFTDILVIKDLK